MAAGKGYSAGAIFLQVVPVFANVQRAIESEAENMDRALGDQMEKSGEKAGKRAGKAAAESVRKELKESSKKIGDDMERELKSSLQGLEKAIGGVNTKNLGKKLRGEIQEMRRELEALSDVDLKIDDNFEKVAAKAAALRAQIEAMRKRSKVFFDIDGLPQVYRQLAQLEQRIDRVNGNIDIDVDTSKAERKIGRFERDFRKVTEKAARELDGLGDGVGARLRDELDYLKNLRIGVDISANRARQELGEIRAEVEELALKSPDIDVKVGTTGAMAELARFEAALRKIDGEDIDIDVDVDTDRVRGKMRGVAADGDKAANSFRSFNVVLLAVAAVGPGLVPVLGAIGGGLLALGPAAGVAVAGLSSVLIGFSGIGDAVKALQDRQEDQAQTAIDTAKKNRSAMYAVQDAQQAVVDAQRNAARAAEDAARSVADAQEQAAQDVEDALERQEDAQDRYRDSVDRVRQAEANLREAREAARKDAESLDRRVRSNALDIDQALLDSFDATTVYQAAQSDGSATNAEQEQARINMEQAKIRLEELREEAADLAKQKRQWDRQGADGTERVKDAQQGLNDAIESQRDSYEALRDAAAAVDEARSNGAERVADAIRNQNRVLADNARAVERSREALRRARESAADTYAEVATQQQAVDDAFAKLGPAGRRFARFIQSLREGFYEFRNDVQAVLLPAVEEAMRAFGGSESANALRDALINLAEGFGVFLKKFSSSLQGGAWLGFFEMLRDLGPEIQDAYGDAFIALMEGIASVLTVVAPYALRFAEGLESMMKGFARWASSKEGAEGIENFMDYVMEEGPKVLDFIGQFFRAAARIGQALAPLGDLVLVGLTALFELIGDQDPDSVGFKILAAIVTILPILIVASQVAYGVMNLLLAGAALLTSTVGVVVFALVGIAIAVAYLYRTNKRFRDFVNDAWKRISGAIKQAWEDNIKPALFALRDAFMELWQEVLAPFLAWLAPILLWAAEKIIPLFGLAFRASAEIIKFFVTKIMVPVIRALLVIVRGVFKGIATLAKWLWREGIKPALDWITDAFESLVDRFPWIEDAFRMLVEGISALWDGLREAIAAPIRFVIETVLNKGLIAGLNKVADWVGMEGFNAIPVPGFLKSPSVRNGARSSGGRGAAGGGTRAYASGGILDGYTPGRDVHHYSSPTGGGLSLSGGEAIMRPEWTQAMGADWIYRMNAIAASQGVRGIRDLFGQDQRFAKGGIVFPVRGGYVNRSAYNLGHNGMDINHVNDASGRVPFVSATSGRVTTTGYSRGYGNAVFVASPYGELVYGHALDGSIGVRPGQNVSPGQFLAMIGNTGNSTGPHLHMGFAQNGSFGRVESLLGGALQPGKIDFGPGGMPRMIPDWLMSLVRNPLGAIKNMVTSTWDKASEALQTPLFDTIKKAPLALAKKATDKVWDMVPGFVKTAAGWAGNAAEWTVGGLGAVGGAVKDGAGYVGEKVADGAGAVADFLGFSDGGVLPYNGTMMYDNGGLLPPGLTSVMNLTGKPEPVFTSDQWDNMERGGAGIHYEPHFEGSDLGPEDVASDLNFTFRRMQRGGRYAHLGG